MPDRLPIAHMHAPSVQTRTFAIPFIVLGTIVLASAIQTELANYLAQKLEFNKPYFCFFVTHVAFSFVFPIHHAVLAVTHAGGRGARGAATYARYLLRNLRAVLADQLGTPPRWRQLSRPLTRKIVPLTLLISFPAICWYVAMALSPAMDITAIYATSAFYTYFFSLLLLGTRLTKITVAAIAVAFIGVIVITLDDAGGSSDGSEDNDKDGKAGPAVSNRLLGDIIMVIGAALLGLYEVVYKMVLPEGEGGTHRHAGDPIVSPIDASNSLVAAPPPVDELEDDEDSDDNETRIALSSAAGAGTDAGSRTPLLGKATAASPSASRNGSPVGSISSITAVATGAAVARPTLTRTPSGRHMHVPHLPAAFHSNFLTSALGVATLAIMWIPFPFIHWWGIEEFMWPQNGKVWGTLIVVASMGAIYNAGLMTLIGIWGPTVASVANLLTIGLVGIADAFWMGSVPSILKVVGAALICAGFATLLWEGDSEG